MRNDRDVSSELTEDLDDSTTAELGDLELVDSDEPETVVGLMAKNASTSPDPASIASSLAAADVDDFIGQDDPAPESPRRKSKPKSLEKRLTFDHVPQPRATRRASARNRQKRRPWLRRVLDRLFGRRD